MTERVPRYTSYPTAPHFHAGVGADYYEVWLGALKAQHTLSLYFHIPYCRQLCWFCGCHTKVVNQYEPIANYMALLTQEVALVSRKVSSSPVTHIHFGGGSPTVIKAEDFAYFMSLVRDAFLVEADAEIAVELDPRTVDADKIAAYAASGVSRASLGVQDFMPQVQEAINRVQPYAVVSDVVRELRRHDINALNVDLIYGLPYQTEKTIRQTIEQTLSLEPDRISLFGYAHVPWMKKHQQLVPQEALPGETARLAMFEAASVMLQEAGYIAIGLDHFAKPGDALTNALEHKTLQRNFQGYTTDKANALLGLGVSSISSLPQGYVQNTAANIDYAQNIKAGALPVVRGIALSEEDIERRTLIMSLMCHRRVMVDEKTYAAELEWLEPYFKAGDITYVNEELLVNPRARNRLRLIASAFDAYLSDTNHRYSQAV